MIQIAVCVFNALSCGSLIPDVAPADAVLGEAGEYVTAEAGEYVVWS